jgi:hypothetical protein
MIELPPRKRVVGRWPLFPPTVWWVFVFFLAFFFGFGLGGAATQISKGKGAV